MGKIFSYLKPYWFKVVLIILLVAATSIATLKLPDYMADVIGKGIAPVYYVMDPNTGQYVETNQVVYSMASPEMRKYEQAADFTYIAKQGGKMLAVTFASMLASIALMYLSSQVASGLGRDVRSDFYKKLNSLSLSETSKFGTATLITRSTNDILQVQNFMIMALRMMVRVPIIFVGALYFSLRQSVQMTNVVLGGIPLLLIIIVVVFITLVPLFKIMQKRIDRMTLVAREGINGVRVIRAFGQGKREVKRFETANEELYDVSYKAGRIFAFVNPAINLIFNMVVTGVVFFSYTLIKNGTLTSFADLGHLSAVMRYAFQIMFSVLMLTMTFIMLPRAQVSGNRLKEVLETEPSIVDTGSDEYDDHEFKGNVKFDDVCFAFPEAEENILNNIHFEAKPGETVAIIGSTGSGKSTVVNLIPRLFDISCGSLTIDGVPIKDIKLEKLRSLIGFVSQTAVLLSGSIKENILFGNDKASDEEIAKAAEIAQAKDFIEKLDDKYDSIVDQGGVNFSGGQKQRISIARAIVRKPKIYIFDDSFSALDFRTDAALRKALKEEVTDATVFIVAQRIGTVMDADKIVVLHEGKMVGIGKHKELLETCDVYKEIALSQLDEEELA